MPEGSNGQVLAPVQELVQRLDQGAVSFPLADLRGADLSGRTIGFVSLQGARLDGANLRGARLHHVDLSTASLRGVRLEEASFQRVTARGADLTGSLATGSFWEQVDLVAADLSGIDLQVATLRGCLLDRARLDGANLAQANLLQCCCDEASFRNVDFEWSNTLGSTFLAADFTGARRFMVNREVIAELLRREVGDDLAKAEFAGAVAIGRAWCYPEWKAEFESRSELGAFTEQVFQRFPRSGVLAALRIGWRGDDDPKVSDGLTFGDRQG